jgi:hypothetical protein
VSTVRSVRPSQHVQQPGSEADTCDRTAVRRLFRAVTPSRPTGLVFTLLFAIVYVTRIYFIWGTSGRLKNTRTNSKNNFCFSVISFFVFLIGQSLQAAACYRSVSRIDAPVHGLALHVTVTHTHTHTCINV